jgi:hypothetical protein
LTGYMLACVLDLGFLQRSRLFSEAPCQWHDGRDGYEIHRGFDGRGQLARRCLQRNVESFRTCRIHVETMTNVGPILVDACQSGQGIDLSNGGILRGMRRFRIINGRKGVTV